MKARELIAFFGSPFGDLRQRRDQVGRLLLRGGRWRSGIDPLLDQRDLFGFEMLLLARRHKLVLARLPAAAFEKLHEPRVIRVARDDGLPIFPALHERGECLQIELAIRIVLAVAVDAMLLEQRRDFRGVVDRGRRDEEWRTRAQ